MSEERCWVHACQNTRSVSIYYRHVFAGRFQVSHELQVMTRNVPAAVRKPAVLLQFLSGASYVCRQDGGGEGGVAQGDQQMDCGL